MRSIGSNGLGAPILLMVMMAMIVVPLAPFMLDVFFSFNISLALVVLLVTVYSLRPLEFSLFPTILLITTLLRLALNVASTRVVLLEGHTGGDAAGQVIKAFGEFVVGGNYAVGIIVFAILVIINFVVITKGATRISEVSARFTLDAMPGKQMAIDADLNAGLIEADEARRRRDEISSEAEFYGSMDGASKFVRGDAVAGILILLINILGGLVIGILQHDLSFAVAAKNYVLLTIGDGLVAQIPALLLSTAAGIIVTRVSSTQDMGQQVLSQLFQNPKSLAVTSGILGVMGIIPGMPHFAFLTLSLVSGLGAYYIKQRQSRPEVKEIPVEKVEQAPESRELSWDDVTPVDTIGLEVGYRLIPMVDKEQGGQLMSRIKGVRKKLSQELGFLVPAVHIRDNLELPPNGYRITLMGVSVGEADIQPDKDMAINPGQVYGSIAGVETKDPAFGLDALWIEGSQRDQAQTLGYTVVDSNTVIATHLSQLLQTHANELLGHEEVQHLLDKLAESAPKLVENLVPDTLNLGTIVKVLQSLLAEGIPVRDIRTIAETLAEHASRSQDPDELTSAVRTSLGRMIVQQINGMAAELSVITLDPNLEQLLHQAVQADGVGGVEPGLAERLFNALQESVQKQEAMGQSAVLLVSALIRTMLARFVRHTIPNLHVLSYNEIPSDKQIRIVATVGQ
ncbi:MAG: flagellar biosynthesis protein FlhA [Gammaproteobacteria bacterium]|nr:flagellar biosynthesis protein FlhA [Gammaproteobacteria bacterium]MCW8987858.1 flagellar biosynthesis protein FlhA [Gammaproteobacteria bacterium]MCW9031862.1 flagellar biosynthesis protein FlhA [Gammaproteobacteria bacterium]